MADKTYLDKEGLLYLWTKLKTYFVKKESGKGLSTNDLTNTLKSNYDAAYTHSTTSHAPSDAEKNTIIGVQKNGADVVIDASTRKVNITVPTKTSDITNDSGFITTGDIPEGAAASTTTPKMDGTASAGKELAFARGDHVHPSDTSKVDKVSGKGLSTNDLTDALKSNYDAAYTHSNATHAPSNAQANVIESIKVNGTAQTITSKSVDIAVPTNNNQLTNGAGYQTSAQVESAITAKNYATKSEVATAVANAAHLKREILSSSTLPDVSSADANTIYMLPITSATGDNKFTEWMVINGAWEKTGDSDVDLSGYAKTTDFAAITNGEIDTVVAS